MLPSLPPAKRGTGSAGQARLPVSSAAFAGHCAQALPPAVKGEEAGPPAGVGPSSACIGSVTSCKFSDILDFPFLTSKTGITMN